MADASAEGRAQDLFDEFVSAVTCRAVLRAFSQLCEHLHLDRSAAERPLYRPIKQRLNYWKANALWTKLDRRAAQQENLRARACNSITCVVIGAGPCGLRTAVELSFMGARVVLLEKRDSFSRNNVLHLWPFTIYDLRGLGAKKFYGKFCAGSIDHISIRQLQLVLLKVALLLGVEVHVGVEFKNLVDPPEDQHRRKVGFRVEVMPKSHPVSQLEFDVIIGADGRRNTLPGFRRKEFRGKLAIAITANFKNRNTTAEAKVEEISGVAFIFNQRFFQDLRQETGIDLENIVYYKDDTHYFVMTAKKQSLLDKGVILQDFAETEQLLSRGNVDQDALQAYAREAAGFSTSHQLPSLDFAMNQYGQPDVAMFDFTCMYASENAAMVRQRRGHQLLVTLVGDSLLEPFWPMGTGVARGFLAALDSAWMIRRWARGGAALDVLAERESLYRLLPQATPENMQRNVNLFSVDPATRYLNVSPLSITPAQVRHLVDTGEEAGPTSDRGTVRSPRFLRRESFSQSNQLLSWCQQQTCGYRGVAIGDLTSSWRSGLALCALIHRYRPDLIDFESLDETLVEDNTRLGFDVAEQEFGISPLMTVEEMLSVEEPDSLSMVMYLSQFYQLLKDSPPPAGGLCHNADLRSALITPASLLSRLGHSPSRKRNPKDQREAAGKKRKTSRSPEQESCDLGDDVASQVCMGGSRVRLMANQLQAKLDESLSTCRSSSSASLRRQGELISSSSPPSESTDTAVPALPWRPKKRTLLQEQMSFRFKEKIKSQSMDSDEQVAVGSSDMCFFCKKRVYVMERLSAEGLFFHRSCFQCDHCSSSLRPAAYTYDHHSGRFFCLQHHNDRLDAPAVRKRPTPCDGAASHRTSVASAGSDFSVSSSNSLISVDRRSSAVSMMTARPERIELENYRRSSTQVSTDLQEEPEEVSEEVLNRFNLSPDQNHSHRSSSGTEDEEGGRGGRSHVTSHKSAWSKTLQLPLRCNEEEDEEPESSDEEEEFCLLASRSFSSAAGGDVKNPDTPVESGSTSNLQPFPLSDTSPTGLTPSTASYLTSPDSTHEVDKDSPPPTASQKHVPQERGSIHDVSPIQSQKTHLPQQDGRVEDWEVGGGKPRGTCSLPALQGGGAALLLQLKALRPVEMEEGGPRALWRTVFPGHRKEKNRRGGTSASSSDRLTVRESEHTRLTEDSDLDSSTLLQRCSVEPRNNLRVELVDLMSEIQRVTIKEEEENQEAAYVPHALAFKRAYAIKRCSMRKDHFHDSDGQSSCPTEVLGVLVQPREPSSLSVKETLFQGGQEEEDNLDAQITRRVQRAARRQAKQDQLKRLHKAQMIQRQLQQVEEKQRQLEKRGVMVEKALRGEADYWGDSTDCQDVDLLLGGLGKLDNPALMQHWFQLVQQKNSLVRYESELIIFARELELEDRQSRLQQELRERMAVDDHLKEEWQLTEERLILEEMLEVVEQRDSLVSLLEEQRLLERQEDQDLDEVIMTPGLGLSWT
ncbi:protein-methionine sulfoxide oxidase mical3a-like isoform X2 [Betta splendens]|uniref:F-actin monooxygenase n=1 Tax=Betta splendens TaxID=158456 RepID=A0A9W2Y1I7_BETSP|nr:protein-methionine sulfoxide oxidase mical3a-like isoform X2 [Betta splendens]